MIIDYKTPFTDKEIQKNVISKHFDKFRVVTKTSKDYNELLKKFSDISGWESIYRSSTYTGYARISPDKTVIKAMVLVDSSLTTIFYINKNITIEPEVETVTPEQAIENAAKALNIPVETLRKALEKKN